MPEAELPFVCAVHPLSRNSLGIRLQMTVGLKAQPRFLEQGRGCR